MILIVTNKFDPHADKVIKQLNFYGVAFIRFNTEDFPSKVFLSFHHDGYQIFGYLTTPIRNVDISDIRSVWYRRPEPPWISPEVTGNEGRDFAEKESRSAISNFYQLLNCFWIDRPEFIRMAENKLLQLKLAAELGFNVPKTLATVIPQQARDFFTSCSNQMVNKVLGRGMIEKDGKTFLMYTHKLTIGDMGKIDNVKHAPALFQEYIPKKIEVRITIVGKNIFAVEIHSQKSPVTKHDWRHYDFAKTPHYIHNLPVNISSKCLELLDHFGLNFGTIDLILTPNDEYVFLELNPTGQWLWLEYLTGLPISQAVAELLINHDK